ncbi:MAG: hypothetical protein LBT60_02880, partial [Oscillospiraceae bacterium]|nr:hypothetical protein [Oscillospiraceae bacterium]
MKKFIFTLQALLNVKIALEKQRKAELAAANARLDELNRELSALEARLEAQLAEYRDKGGHARELATRHQGFETMYALVDSQRESVKVAEGERDRVRRLLSDTM